MSSRPDDTTLLRDDIFDRDTMVYNNGNYKLEKSNWLDWNTQLKLFSDFLNPAWFPRRITDKTPVESLTKTPIGH